MKSATTMQLFVKWKLVPIKLTPEGTIETDLLSSKFLLSLALRMMVLAGYFYQMYLHQPTRTWNLVAIVDMVFRILVYMGNEMIPLLAADGAKRIGKDILAGRSLIPTKFFILNISLNVLFFGGLSLLLVPTLLMIESPWMMAIFGLTILMLTALGIVDHVCGFTMFYLWIKDYVSECNVYLSEKTLARSDLMVLLDKYEKLKHGFEKINTFFFTCLQMVVILSFFVSISGEYLL